MKEEQEQIYRDFKQNINMSPKEIESWLDTEASKSVGIDSGDGESKGRKSARRIIDIRRKKKAELDEDDFSHMKKVNAYVKRHSAQPPSSGIEDSKWRYSLMNWGHDPCKEMSC
jgi:hypothetical protein